MAHAQSRGHFFKIEWSHVFHHFGPLHRISSHSLGQSIPKTAFNSPFGKYEYVKVPFRLAQAPGTSDMYTQGFSLCHSLSG